ncbi:PAS domain-containing sensor histidine kinase [Thiohalobacter thiocyanaticus]|nr:PAS domain S-box protein [Thiohalobacter thiocyanaticus]
MRYGQQPYGHTPCHPFPGSCEAPAAEFVLDRAFHAMQEAVLVFDPDDHCIRACNPAASALFGYHHEQLIGSSIEILYPDRRSFRAFAAESDLELDRRSRFRRELSLQHQDGTTIHTETTVISLRDTNSLQRTRLCLIRDITEYKQQEQALHRLNAHLQQVREAERRLIARELHDELGGVLTLISIRQQQVQQQLHKQVPELSEELHQLADHIHQAGDVLRRLIGQLRPPLLDLYGLQAALEDHVAQVCSCTGLQCELRLDWPGPGQDWREQELTLFRICQEALNNVVKHAGATRVELALSHTRRQACLVVRDDGCGIRQAQIRHSDSYGIQCMNERLRAQGGWLDIKANPGRGTTLKAVLPLTGSDRCRQRALGEYEFGT